MEQLLFTTDGVDQIVTSDRVLYTPSVFARTNLLHLQEIGTLKANRPHISRRSNLSSYLFFNVISGSGMLTYDGKTYRLHAGDCVFIDCRKPYSHETTKDLWSLRWIHFHGPNMSGIYDKYVERGGRPVFHPEAGCAFSILWKTVFELSSSSDYIRDMKINAELNNLLTLLMSESWNPGIASDSHMKKQNVLPVKVYLDEHYTEKISLDSLAERFFISKYYLTRVFKEQFGISVNNYLLSVRITKAKQMLRFTDEKLENIGYACGLGAANYFSRTFKNVEGINPSEYREKWQT